MILGLSLILSFFASEGFRARLVVEEAGRENSYIVDFKEEALRIEPEHAGVYLLMNVPSRSVILVRPPEREYCRLDLEGFRRLMSMGTIDISWFPWVSRVGPDLVENLQLRESGSFRLPDGRTGLTFNAYAENYDRIIAEYSVDPEAPRDLFFLWRSVYSDFWAEDNAEQDLAQEKRLELYDRLPGVPLKMVERFDFLSRSRTLRLEDQEPIPAGSFSVPEDFVEKTVYQLLWEDLIRRLELWFRESVEKP